MPTEVSIPVPFKKLPATLFTSPEAAIIWIDTELRLWSWASLTRPGFVSVVSETATGNAKKVVDRLGEAKQVCARLRDEQTLSPADQSSLAGSVAETLVLVYDEWGTVHSASPAGIEMSQLTATEAAGFYSELVADTAKNTQAHEAMRGVMAAREFKHGRNNLAPSYAAALDGLRETHVSIVNGLKADGAAALRVVGGLHEEWKIKLAKLHGDGEAQLGNQRGEFDGALNGTKNELAKLTATYKEHMKLEAPVKYWTDKARTHAKLAWLFGAASLVAGGGMVALVIGYAPDVPGASAEGTSSLQLPLVSYVPMAALALLGVWLLRVFVRIVLSHTHLASDAGQRAIVAQVYLALLKDSGADEKEHRALALATLFRPASTGLVKDDALPQTPLTEIVARVTDSRG